MLNSLLASVVQLAHSFGALASSADSGARLSMSVQSFTLGLAQVGGGMGPLIGEQDRVLVVTLALLMTLDVLSGFLVAFINGVISSTVSWKGGSKKLLTLTMVVTAYMIELVIEMPVGRGTVLFFLATEAISILENGAAAGLPLPPVLRDAITRMKRTRDG